jgi:hypothetical protein
MKDYKVTVNKDKKENSTQIVLQGHLGLGQMTEIKADVLKAIKGAAVLSVVVKEVEESDISLFQLISAIEKHCKSNKIAFKVEYNLPADQKNLFVKSGIHI